MIFHILTAVLVVLKVLELISLSWWWVIAPSVIAVIFACLIIIGAVGLKIWTER